MSDAPNTGLARFFGPATDAHENNRDPFSPHSTPWGSGLVDKPDPFWSQSAAMGYDGWLQNWNKLFPFQLLWLTKEETGYKIQSRFTLPIPPQAMSISTPFAINTSITMGGVLEEHNGTPLRMISLQGTTGVFPLRGSAPKPSRLETELSGIFAGTATGIRQIGTSISQAGNLLGISSQTPNIVLDNEMRDKVDSTGFYQFQLLRRFLEAYALYKKTPAGRNARLGFAVWKDQEIYLVTPVSFDLSRTAASPLEYPYSLTMKAWRRIQLTDTNPGSYEGHVGGRDPNKLALVTNTIESGRRVLEGARNVLTGVRADIQSFYNVLRQVCLFCKDTVGVVLTAVDMPSDIIKDFREPVLELASTGSAFAQLATIPNRFTRGIDGAVQAVNEAFAELSGISGKIDTGAGRVVSEPNPNKKRGSDFTGDIGDGAGGLGSIRNKNNAARANKVIDNPLQNFKFFETIKISDLNLRPATIRKIEAERQTVRQFQRQDFESARDQTLGVLADFSDFVGAGNATFTRTYSEPVRTTTRTPTDDEWEIIHSLSSIAQQLDTLAASAQINKNQVSVLDYVAGLANRSGIAFQVPKSKFAVPFPYGYTLEQLSLRYLGTADRWHEIATLNGLRAPYVDEIGFKLSLQTNGNGTQVLVSDGSNLYVGQKVWLESSTVRRESRRIQSVTQLGTNQFAVVVDGDDDLSKFKTVDGAFLQAFQSGTVNSQQQVYIPSDTEPDDEDFRVKSIPGVDYFDPLVQSGGIDLLLTTDGDLVITPDGDSRLAVGLTNLIQKVRLAIATPRGSLLQHQDYGVGLVPGTSTADLTADQVRDSLRNLFKYDSGYLGVQSVKVLKSANNMLATMVVGISGTNQYIPVQVEIQR